MVKALVFLVKEFLLASVAVAGAVAVFNFLPKEAPLAPPAEVRLAPGTYFPNPSADPVTSHLALKHFLENGQMVLFGSSELTVQSEVAPQRLFPRACGKPILTLGHAGFQSLPILLALADVRESLGPQSNVYIILSPVWFEERGTSSSSFLSFLKPFAMSTWSRAADYPEQARMAINREVKSHRDEFLGLYPDWLFMKFRALAKWVRPRGPDLSKVAVVAEAVPTVRNFDWNGLEEKWKSEMEKKAEGNPLGTTMDYYNRVKKQNPPYNAGHLDPAQIEKQDLYALSGFLRAKGVQAHFILQPIHRRVFKRLEPYDRLFAEVAEHLRADGHQWKSYFTEPYDLTILNDAAHFSDYMWVRLQRGWCTP